MIRHAPPTLVLLFHDAVCAGARACARYSRTSYSMRALACIRHERGLASLQ